MTGEEKILIVDDEPLVLSGIYRQLHQQFSLHLAEGPKQALKAMEEDGPFAVVVSDMTMPHMTGAHFLEKVRTLWPETVRLMLTGNADQQTAVEAVNKGHVYRFLSKPCPAKNLALAIDAALSHYRILCAEKAILSQTLNGSISLLAEVLAILSPSAFGRVTEIRSLAESLCRKLRVVNDWEVSAASLLAFIGCITLGESTLNRYFNGESLSPPEKKSVENHPIIGARLVRTIPRLCNVAEIISRQQIVNDVHGDRNDRIGADDLAMSANIVRTAVHFVMRLRQGSLDREIIESLRCQPDTFHPLVVNALSEAVGGTFARRQIVIEQLSEGMVIDEPLLSRRGDLLLAAGQTIGPTMLERLLSIAKAPVGIKQPFSIRVR